MSDEAHLFPQPQDCVAQQGIQHFLLHFVFLLASLHISNNTNQISLLEHLHCLWIKCLGVHIPLCLSYQDSSLVMPNKTTSMQSSHPDAVRSKSTHFPFTFDRSHTRHQPMRLFKAMTEIEKESLVRFSTMNKPSKHLSSCKMQAGCTISLREQNILHCKMCNASPFKRIHAT